MIEHDYPQQVLRLGYAYMTSCKVCSTPTANTVYCSEKCHIAAYRTGNMQWEVLRDFAIRKANYCCQHCGRFLLPPAKASIHHIKPLQDDGENIDSNLIALCPSCHRQAHLYRGADNG